MGSSSKCFEYTVHVSIGKIPFGDLLFAIVFHMKL